MARLDVLIHGVGDTPVWDTPPPQDAVPVLGVTPAVADVGAVTVTTDISFSPNEVQAAASVGLVTVDTSAAGTGFGISPFGTSPFGS